MNTTIIVGLLTTLTAIVTAIITNFLSKQTTLRFEERELKEQYYLEFIHALSKNMNNLNMEDVIIRYNHAFNNLIIIASPSVLSSLYEFSDLLIRHLKHGDVIDYETKYTGAITNLVKEMRADLYSNNSKQINKDLPDIYLISGILKVSEHK